MSIAFSLRCAASRHLRRANAAAHGLGAVGAALAALQLAGNGAVTAATALLALSAAALVVSWRRALRGGTGGTLQVDAHGGAFAAHGVQPLARFVPLRWFSGLGLTWLEGRVDDVDAAAAPQSTARGGESARPIRLLIGRDAVPPADWTRLQRWLRWLERGGGAPTPTRGRAASAPH